MTTITALNVRLGMDASNFSAGADLARTEVNRVAAIMRQSVPPAEKFQQELALLNKAFSDTGKKTVQYANAVEHLKKKHEQVVPAIKATASASKEASNASANSIATIKGLVASYVGLQTASKALSLANNVEDANIAFEVLTGNVNDGKLLFEQVRQFAASSPVTFSNAIDATKTMMSFGIEAQKVQKTLQMLSDVTGGNNERFKSLSLAYSQSAAAGRLMGQDLLQMINAGFNPLQQISKTTGESLVELKKRMEDGGISTAEVAKAFEDATSQGGMFYGMTERLAATVGGKLNIALSEMEQRLAEAGAQMRPVMLTLLDAFNRLQPVLKAVVNLIDGISQGLGFAIAAITDIINSVSTFSVDTTEMNKFLDMLEKREREQAAEKANNVANEFQQRNNAENEALVAKRKAEQEAEAMRAKAEDDQRKAMEKAWKQQQENIEKERKARIKAIEDARKAQQKAEQQAREAFQKELEDARKAALDYFEKRKQKLDARRADVAKGPGAGIEAGSSEAVKFAADAVNQVIAQKAVPKDPLITQADLAKKTAELLIAQREANARQQTQIELAELQLKELRENKFTRLR